MTDLREKLADLMDKTLGEMAKADTHYSKVPGILADAIIAALPGMVKPLEWRGEDARSLGGTYTYKVVGGKWSLWLRNFLIDVGTAESFESARDRAKAVANVHHRATIVAALGVEGE